MSHKASQNNKIFVGGFPVELSEEELISYMKKFGEVLSVKILQKNGRSRGFGFVTFKTSKLAKHVIQLVHSINGKTFDCKSLMSERQAKTQSKAQKKRKIFVGGISKKVTESMLYDYFAKYGKVERAVINKEHYTNASRGSGFVLFKESSSAELVLNQETYHILKGKKFDCQTCLLREEIKKATKESKSGRRVSFSSRSSKSNSFYETLDSRRESHGVKSRLSKQNSINIDHSISEASYSNSKRSRRSQPKFRSANLGKYEDESYSEKRYEGYKSRGKNKPQPLTENKILRPKISCYTPLWKQEQIDCFPQIFGRERNDRLNVISKRMELGEQAEIPERVDTPCYMVQPLTQSANTVMLYNPISKETTLKENTRARYGMSNYVLNYSSTAIRVPDFNRPIPNQTNKYFKKKNCMNKNRHHHLH